MNLVLSLIDPWRDFAFICAGTRKETCTRRFYSEDGESS